MDNRIGTVSQELGQIFPELCLDGKTKAVRGMDTIHIGNGNFAVIPPFYRGDADAEVAKLKQLLGTPAPRTEKVKSE